MTMRVNRGSTSFLVAPIRIGRTSTAATDQSGVLKLARLFHWKLQISLISYSLSAVLVRILSDHGWTGMIVGLSTVSQILKIKAFILP